MQSTSVDQLVVTVRDAELVSWLRQRDGGDGGEAAGDALRVGVAVLQATRLTVSNELPSALTQRIDALQTSLDTMLRASSQQRGVVGEQLVLEQLRRAFPLDVFELVGSTPLQADILGRVSCGDGLRQVRIEAKNHVRTVPAAELEKFRRDVRQTGADLGLFMSLQSSVAGVRGRMAIERSQDAAIVIVPDAGVDGTGALWGLLLLKALSSAINAADVDADEAFAAVSSAAEELRANGQAAAALEEGLAAASAAVDAARWRATEMRRHAAAAERRML